MINIPLFIGVLVLLYFVLFVYRKEQKKSVVAILDKDAVMLSPEDMVVLLDNFMLSIESFYKHTDFYQWENVRMDINRISSNLYNYLHTVPELREKAALYDDIADEYALDRAVNRTNVGEEYDATLYNVLKNAKIMSMICENDKDIRFADISWINQIMDIYKQQMLEIYKLKDVEIGVKETPIRLRPDMMPLRRYNNGIKPNRLVETSDSLSLPEMTTISTKNGNMFGAGRRFAYDRAEADDRLDKGTNHWIRHTVGRAPSQMDGADEMRIRMRGTPEMCNESLGHDYDYLENI